MSKRAAFRLAVCGLGAWGVIAALPVGAAPSTGRSAVSYSVAAVSGAPLVLSDFEGGLAATQVVYRERGQVEVDGGLVVYSAPKNFSGLDHFSVMLCGSSMECAFGSYEVTVRMPTKPLLGFGTPPRPVTSVGLNETVSIGLDLMGSTARVVALPLLALVLGVALFSVGGPGTPLFNSAKLAGRLQARYSSRGGTSVQPEVGNGRAGEMTAPAIKHFAPGGR